MNMCQATFGRALWPYCILYQRLW